MNNDGVVAKLKRGRMMAESMSKANEPSHGFKHADKQSAKQLWENCDRYVMGNDVYYLNRDVYNVADHLAHAKQNEHYCPICKKMMK